MNRLAATHSPYLLQHADNPVAWQAWDEEALRMSRGQDMPTGHSFWLCALDRILEAA